MLKETAYLFLLSSFSLVGNAHFHRQHPCLVHVRLKDDDCVEEMERHLIDVYLHGFVRPKDVVKASVECKTTRNKCRTPLHHDLC